MPQIWDDYSTGDPEEVRLRRIGDMKAASEKKKAAQAAVRQARATAREKEKVMPRRTGRKRKRTGRAEVRHHYLLVLLMLICFHRFF